MIIVSTIWKTRFLKSIILLIYFEYSRKRVHMCHVYELALKKRESDSRFEDDRKQHLKNIFIRFQNGLYRLANRQIGPRVKKLKPKICCF